MRRAAKGKETKRWYQGEYGWDQGDWPIAVQMADSEMLLADLSYRDRKLTGSGSSWVAMAASKIRAKSS